MADLILIEELQAYLVAQGIGQLPGATPSLSVPSIWLLPRDGAALPRNLEKVGGSGWTGETTITLRDTNLSGPPGLEAWIEEAFVDIITRAPQAGTGKLIQRQIKGLLSPFDRHNGRAQWMMSNLLVEQSMEWRGDQELPQRQSIAEGDPHVTYDRVASYRFRCRRKILAGLTLP